MTTEQWKPTVDEVRLAYIDRKDFEAQLNRSWADEGAARAEFDRFLAKIKANALREAARDMRAQVERATEHQRFTEHELIEGGVEHVLNEYADRIEAGEER